MHLSSFSCLFAPSTLTIWRRPGASHIKKWGQEDFKSGLDLGLDYNGRINICWTLLNTRLKLKISDVAPPKPTYLIFLIRNFPLSFQCWDSHLFAMSKYVKGRGGEGRAWTTMVLTLTTGSPRVMWEFVLITSNHYLTPSVTKLLRGEIDSKQWDVIQAKGK